MLAYLGRIKLKGAVDAGGHAGENDSGVAFKAFSPAVNQWNDGTWIQDTILIHQQRQLHRETERLHKNRQHYPEFIINNTDRITYHHSIHPPPGNYRVQSTDDYVEL